MNAAIFSFERRLCSIREHEMIQRARPQASWIDKAPVSDANGRRNPNHGMDRG